MHEKLQPFGYDYINVDSGWNGSVDGNGLPVPSTELYPDGLQTVIDHVHANGQKFGLYFIPGISPEVLRAVPALSRVLPSAPRTASWKQPIQQADYWNIGYRIDFSNPCSQKTSTRSPNLLDSWGVDFVKFDSVTPGSGVSDLSLDARDDVAAWSVGPARSAASGSSFSWALDINYADYWKQDGRRLAGRLGRRVLLRQRRPHHLGQHRPPLPPPRRLVAPWRPGAGWNDLDSLDVGNGSMDGLTRDERRTATTLWAISAAPMYLGNDLTQLDQFGLDLVTNKEVIAVNQVGTPAQPCPQSPPRSQVWYALNADGTYTVALFNLGLRPSADITANWADSGSPGAEHPSATSGPARTSARPDTGFTAEDVPIPRRALAEGHAGQEGDGNSP